MATDVLTVLVHACFYTLRSIIYSFCLINVIIGIIFSFNPDPKVRNTFWTLTIGGAFTAMPVWTVSQTAVQRFLAIRSLKDAKR